jgi:hypothetical protein
MTTVYLIMPGTLVAISRDGSDFKPHTTRRPPQFAGPTVTTHGEMTFHKRRWQNLVNRANVVVCRYDGQYGVNQWGA